MDAPPVFNSDIFAWLSNPGNLDDEPSLRVDGLSATDGTMFPWIEVNTFGAEIGYTLTLAGDGLWAKLLALGHRQQHRTMVDYSYIACMHLQSADEESGKSDSSS